MKHEPVQKRKKLMPILCTILLFISLLACLSALWYIKVYGRMGFSAILFTLSTLQGVASGLVNRYLLSVLLPAVLLTALLSFLFFSRKIKWKQRTAGILCSLLSVGLLVCAAASSGLIEYVYQMSHTGSLYEDDYVDPRTVNISFPEQKRNLIYIYMESMEVSFLSKELGGALEQNVIPELYQLAHDHVNFSQNEDVGGFIPLDGMEWTIAGMVSQTAGIPLKTPPGVGGNDYGMDGSFLPGVTSLTDLLAEQGYDQAVMFGSEAEFGGRKAYYQQHQIDTVFDYNTAIEDGLIPEGYKVWWGFEDAKLFPYAKEKLTEMAAREEPFSFTLLTADTHHVGGYLCEDCGSEYPTQYENVYACSSRKVAEFVEWIMQQDFYENTTIILCGDHCSMDAGFFERNVAPDYVRRVYNCIINPATEVQNEKMRLFTTVDLFPTTLAAMGCTIEGERLGLGVNLFSGQPTLTEQYGYDGLNRKLQEASPYYTKNFMQRNESEAAA